MRHGPVAPEVFEMDSNYSFPVDVYSFGLIMWEITSRETPYNDIKPHFKVRRRPVPDGWRCASDSQEDGG